MIKQLISAGLNLAGFNKLNSPIGESLVFSFGDAEPVLNNNTAYLSTLLTSTGLYYETPIEFDQLARIRNANSYHGQALKFKADRIVQFTNESDLLAKTEIKKVAFDYAITGNAYFQVHRNGFGQIIRLSHLPAIYMRRGASLDHDPFGIPGNFYVRISGIFNGVVTQYLPNEVIHIKDYDPLQGVYGLPSYLGGVQEVLLSEESTLFRRKFFANGAHMGYILVTNDAGIDKEQAAEIEKKVKASKGIGNFKSLYVNIDKSNQREPVKVIPIGNIGINDNYQVIKESTEMQIVAMHGIPPILLNIIPANVGGLGNPIDALQLYYEVGIKPMLDKFSELNEITGKKVISFSEPDWKLKSIS